MITTLFQQLPKIYEPMLPAIFGKPIPVEQYADCMNCHMCKPNDAVKDVRTFSEKTKCCTFKPIIPNYLVGAILNDSDNQTKLHDYIKTGTKLAPLGYYPTKTELRDYANIIPDKFGMDESVMCELLVDGNCSVWQYRNSICSSYFCHYYKGIHGKAFWEAVRDFLQFIEEAISEHCALSLGIPASHLTNATTNFFINVQDAQLDATDTNNSTNHWAAWESNKADYFAKCYSIASELTEEKIAALNPNRYAIKLAELTTAFNRMTEPTLPSQLMLNPKCKIIPFDDQQSFFMISRLVKLPSIVAQIAPLFDGQSPTEKVQETAKETLNVDLTNEYILHLYEQSILVAAN